ncbi:MAG: hypothetical protein R3B57_06740 [Phycisphaerales bacterium]
MLIPCTAVIVIVGTGVIKKTFGIETQVGILLALLAAELSPLWLLLIWTLRIRKRVARANYLACPNCLFDLSDLVEPTRCPECGFDVRYLDLPAAWKALFRWSIRGFTSSEDRY